VAIRKSSISGSLFGTTSARPSTASVGQTYYNGTLGALEIWTPNGWTTVGVSSPTVAATNTIVAALPQKLYGSSINLGTGVYSITCPSSTIATVYFYSGITGLIGTATTSSGTASITLTSAVDRVRVWTNTGNNISIVISQTSSVLVNSLSTTLDTITNSGTYTGTSDSGYAYVLAVGGGGGGGSGYGYTNSDGIGGNNGQQSMGIIQLTGNINVTIGGGGAGGKGYLPSYNWDAPNNSPTSGTATIFGSLTANGGGAGSNNRSGGNTSASRVPASPVSLYPFITPSIGGGYGGAGSFGSGSWPYAGDGGGGSSGIVYVLRF